MFSLFSEMRVRCNNAAYESFEFDSNSADFLTNFSITCCLASTSPLILPFGLFYSVCKHFVDSYCLVAGIFKGSELDTKAFYLPVTNIMCFAAVLGQLNVITCLYLCPSNEDQFYSDAYTWAPLIIMLSLVVVIQQYQTNQRWPFRIIPEDLEVPELKEGERAQEPAYEPPIRVWLNEWTFVEFFFFKNFFMFLYKKNLNNVILPSSFAFRKNK